MIAKGRNLFQSKVYSDAEAIKNLLTTVPNFLTKLSQELETADNAISEEYEEWDFELQKKVLRVWHPSTDTTFIWEMMDVFYTSIVIKKDSFVENGLRTLLGENTKPKPPKGQKVPSDIDLYYSKIKEKYAVVLPDIKTLWPNKDNFHMIRKDIVHHGKCCITKEEVNHLPVDVDDTLKMLLFIEEGLRKVNPNYSISF